VRELILGGAERFVIAAVVRADDGLVVFRQVPGEAESRIDRRRAVDAAGCRRAAAIERDPQAGLQPDAIGYPPRILHVEGGACARRRNGVTRPDRHLIGDAALIDEREAAWKPSL